MLLNLKAWLATVDAEALAAEVAENYNANLKIDKQSLREEYSQLEKRIQRITKILVEDDFPSMREELRLAFKRQGELKDLLRENADPRKQRGFSRNNQKRYSQL